MSKKNWYFSRVNYYVNLSNLFAGFGSLVIEGDALLHYLYKEENLEIASKSKLNKFIQKNLKESGFDKIYIVFYHNHSKWTEFGEDSELSLKQPLLQLTSDLAALVKIFNSWTCKEWLNFVDDEHMSVFLTTDCEIYGKKNSQFDLIDYICNTNNLQIALIDSLTFSNLKATCFLIDSNRELHSLDAKDVSLNNADDTNDFNDVRPEYQYQISVLENDLLNSILEVNNNQSLALESTNLATNSTSSILWEIKLHYKKTIKRFRHNENKSKQFYSRHMERYAESLDSSKHLHYKIITNIDSKNQVKPEKMSVKAKEIIEANDFQNLKKKEEKELNFIKSLKIKCYNDIDESFKLVDTSKYTQLAQYTILHLRIKWLQNEPTTYENRKQNLFLFIKEAIEIYEDRLTLTDAENMLKCLKSLEFHSSCEYLKQLLIKNRKDFKSLKKTETIVNSFDHDALFQLRYCGDKLKRTLNSKKDDRVRFEPDKWQRDLLDAVDRNESALICCPTSSGKTFISYYVMEKALRYSHDDIVVFIAPMKALANQAAAEIYARFGSKTYPRGYEKSIYAMSMPDYTINDPYNCQILITVPTSFESMLCENKSEWISKIKYIIIDEIQTINDPELGSSIEKIVHMAQCPMLFISATIGNLDPFFNWLNSIQITKGIKLNRIVHSERFCDLKKYLFSPVDETKIIPMHELFGYSEKHLKNNEIAEEFHLLPSEIAEILSAFEEICSSEEQKSLIASIQPNKFFKNVILNKKDVKNYEAFVMKNLIEWSQSDQFTSEQIKKIFSLINKNCIQAFKKIHKHYGNKMTTRQWSHDHIFELVESLYKRKMLPAIVFLKTCDECDKLTERLVNHLKRLENEERDSKQVKRAEKTTARIEKIKKNLRERKNSGELDRDEYEMFEELNLNTPIINDKYTFLDSKYKLTDQEIDEEISMHKYRKIPSYLFDGWKRGIGVHHSLHHTKFRSSVECLFRKRHLQIVFATETLSLGVNMPCKTVVMPTDCIYINSIYYRHMIGRAGRRGFDTIGNIVFYGVPEKRVKNMISSKTANIRGAHSFDLNLVMQMSAMQNYHSHAYTFFKSFMENSILSLSSTDYEPEKCKQNAFIKIQYLLNKNYINSKFNPLLKSQALFLLRNENIDTFLIIDFILSESFDLILTSNTSNIEEIANRICLFLCYFCHVRYVIPSQAKLLKSCNLKILLPQISELDSFIENEKRNFKFFLNSFSLSESEIEVNQNGYSDYYSVFLPKNSYLYDFYLEGKLERIKEVNNISEATLWYALRDARYLSVALKSLFNKFKGDLINEAYNYFSEKINERFFQVTN